MQKIYSGHCHCQKIVFELMCEDSVEIWNCNCSICSITEYQHLFVPDKKFKLIKGEELLTTYRFGTRAAAHLFCSNCGIKSFYKPRSHPNAFSVNLRCIINPPTIKNIVEFNGKNFEKSLATKTSIIP